jgi:hypothetical protein
MIIQAVPLLEEDNNPVGPGVKAAHGLPRNGCDGHCDTSRSCLHEEVA